MVFSVDSIFQQFHVGRKTKNICIKSFQVYFWANPHIFNYYWNNLFSMLDTKVIKINHTKFHLRISWWSRQFSQSKSDSRNVCEGTVELFWQRMQLPQAGKHSWTMTSRKNKKINFHLMTFVFANFRQSDWNERMRR